MKLRSVVVVLSVLALFGAGLAQTPPPTVDDVEEDVQVEDETPDSAKAQKPPGAAVTKDKDLDEEEEVKALQPSPDAAVCIHFTKPANKQEFAGGVIVKFLVGLHNTGDEMDFIVQQVDASFHYPMDYSFYIQNYTAAKFDRAVPAGEEATFDYAFIPSEQYVGRPLTLSVNINYKDSNGTLYQSSVFNETVNIVEEESTFNPETGFLYIFLACIVVLLLFLGQQFLQKMRKKHGMTKRSAPVEMGTTRGGDVDYDWIPKEVLNYTNSNKSPRPGSPQKSPHQRKTRRPAGGTDD